MISNVKGKADIFLDLPVIGLPGLNRGRVHIMIESTARNPKK